MKIERKNSWETYYLGGEHIIECDGEKHYITYLSPQYDYKTRIYSKCVCKEELERLPLKVGGVR